MGSAPAIRNAANRLEPGHIILLELHRAGPLNNFENRRHGPDRSRLDFSKFGKAVDVQGWGREVTTCGYGDLQGGNNEDFWYTDQFSGKRLAQHRWDPWLSARHSAREWPCPADAGLGTQSSARDRFTPARRARAPTHTAHWQSPRPACIGQGSWNRCCAGGGADESDTEENHRQDEEDCTLRQTKPPLGRPSRRMRAPSSA
jgi:hypothetical protein